MKAVLLAAGVGSRLRPITETVPKALVDVAGRSALERNLDWLRSNGIDEIAVNLHHHADMVRERLGSGLIYSYEDELRGTAGALDPLRDWLIGDRFLVIYADNIIRCDLSALLGVGGMMTIGVHFREDSSASGHVELDGGSVVAMNEKTRTGPGWVSAGVLACESRILAYVPQREVSDFGRDVIPALVDAGEDVRGYQFGPTERLYWIDTPDDLARAHSALVAEEAR